jgi:hypothetical protein
MGLRRLDSSEDILTEEEVKEIFSDYLDYIRHRGMELIDTGDIDDNPHDFIIRIVEEVRDFNEGASLAVEVTRMSQ